MGVFDMNTLMNSNLRGGRSRRPAFQPQRSALDPHRINAIFSRFSRAPLCPSVCTLVLIFFSFTPPHLFFFSSNLPPRSSSSLLLSSVSQMPFLLGFLSPRKESLARASTPNCLRSGSALGKPIGTPGLSDGQLAATPPCKCVGPMRTQRSGAVGPINGQFTSSSHHFYVRPDLRLEKLGPCSHHSPKVNQQPQRQTDNNLRPCICVVSLHSDTCHSWCCCCIMLFWWCCNVVCQGVFHYNSGVGFSEFPAD